MERIATFWYFPMMRESPAIPRVRFNRTKYGRDLLVDVAWIHDMRSFILDAPHSLEFFDITLVTRGRGVFVLDGYPHDVRAGQVFFSQPGQVRLWEVEHLDGLCLFFVDGFIKEFLQDASFVHQLPFFQAAPERAEMHLRPPAARQLRGRLTTMRGELVDFRRDSIPLLRAQLHETLLLLARDYAASHRIPSRRTMHGAVTRFFTLVERDVTVRHRVQDYAAELGVSAGHLSVLCSRYAGTTAKRYVDDALTIRARRLLLYSDESAARIATLLGFEDPSYFARFFRRETGSTPTEFRRMASARGVPRL